MTLLRQGRWFLFAGVTQLALDWALFVALTALGMAPAPANLMGRVGGAMLGFWLNGRLTFATPGGQRLGGGRFVRFAIVWLLLTAVSTALVTAIAGRLGLGHAWLAKPMVEGLLAVVSFLLYRHWVYR